MHRIPLCFVFVLLAVTTFAAETRRLTRDELLDRIRGGWAGQMIGNIQGLPFEFKYKDAPGPLPDFTPDLARCRSDDDTDVEWVHLHAMDRLGRIELPYPVLAREWVRSINRRIWVSNEAARRLMGRGVLPPWTSHVALNPHARYNLSGQFCVESYGFLAPGLPDAAARIGAHYARITVRGEPIQAAAYWTSMIAQAFFETDLERLAAQSLDAVDPRSQHAEMVRDVLQWRRESPDDWREVRAEIQEKYRDARGWNMNATITNGAFVLTALLYGRGDFVETMRLAFALGYDADCNAATCGAILGIMHGAKAFEKQPGWTLPAHYDNQTRDGLPPTESMDDLVALTARLAERVILEEGGAREGPPNAAAPVVYRIPVRAPRRLEPIERDPEEDRAAVEAAVRKDALARLRSDSTPARTFAAIHLAQNAWDKLDAQQQAAVREILAAAVEQDEVLGPLAKRALSGSGAGYQPAPLPGEGYDRPALLTVDGRLRLAYF